MQSAEGTLQYRQDTIQAKGKGWIRNGPYDWFFILGSALIVLLIIGLFSALRLSSTNLLAQGDLAQIILLGVPLLLGGPHIYFSFLRVFRDPEFRMRFPRMVTVLPHSIALMVIYLVFADSTNGFLIGKGPGTLVLVNIVFFSAVFHGLAQLTHVAIKYRKNANEPMSALRVVIDGALIFGGPLAYILHSVRLREFIFVGHRITPIFSQDFIIYGIAGIFGLAAVAYAAEASMNWWSLGVFNWKRFATIVTANVAFIILAEVREADISFQAYNAWHSIQAMGIMWAVSNARLRQGARLYGVGAKLAADGRFLLCYVYGVVFALIIGLTVVLLSGSMMNVAISPWYFVIAVSVLLIHHGFDYFLFFHKKGFDY